MVLLVPFCSDRQQELPVPLQVQRVEKRVSLKKVVAVRLEQELMQAQLAAGRGPKRPAELSQTVVRGPALASCHSQEAFSRICLWGVLMVAQVPQGGSL